MATPSRLNIVCIDNSEFSHNGFEWYVNNHHRPNDVIGLTHVHEMPSLPAIGVMGPAPGVAEVYQSQVEYSYRISKGKFIINMQKISRSSCSQMFFKIGVLKNFCNIHGETPVLKSLLNKVAGLKACNFISKETPRHMFSCELCKIFKNTFFYGAPPVAFSKFLELQRCRLFRTPSRALSNIYDEVFVRK